jgi:site-specific recombinase XerD
MKLSKAVDLFLTGVVADGLSRRTEEWYRYCLAPIVEALGDPPVETTTADDLRGYLAALRGKETRWEGNHYRKPIKGGLSPFTMAGIVRSVKRFFNWLAENGRIEGDKNPAVHLKKPKLPSPQPKFASPEDIRELLKAARESKEAPVRDYLMVLFLADTGCRVAGLVGLKLSDLDLKDSRAWVTEKGRKGRFVFLSPVTKAAVASWLAVRPARGDFLFPGLREHFSAGGVTGMLRRLARDAGIKGRVNPHSFRHAYARGYLDAGGDLGTLCDILGW